MTRPSVRIWCSLLNTGILEWHKRKFVIFRLLHVRYFFIKYLMPLIWKKIVYWVFVLLWRLYISFAFIKYKLFLRFIFHIFRKIWIVKSGWLPGNFAWKFLDKKSCLFRLSTGIYWKIFLIYFFNSVYS